MKKTKSLVVFISVMFAILCFFIGQALGLSYDPSSTYQSPAVVIETDEQTGWVTLVDWNGEAWCIRDDGFTEDELVIVTFNNNETESIYDDLIVKIDRANLVPIDEID